MDCLFVLLLAGVSLVNFVHRGATAFEWPGSDMACFFERQRDPSFLHSDYFTNASCQPNPRFVFGYSVLALAKVLDTDWYGVYFALRVVLTWMLPALWYLAMLGLLAPRWHTEQQRQVGRIVLFAAVFLVMRHGVNAWFSIAWWPPMFIYVGAHPLAISLGLLGIVLRTSQSSAARWLALPAWCFATLMHPVVGPMMVVFYWVATFDRCTVREWLATAAVGIALPSAVIGIAFRNRTQLPRDTFIEYYVTSTHPFHYQVTQFASLTSFPWWVSFLLVVSLMFAAGVYGLVRRNLPLAMLAAAFVLSYCGCVALQYVGVNLWPNRTLAQLGSSRFSSLGYYMVAMLAALACADWFAIPLKRGSLSERAWDRLTVSPAISSLFNRLRPLHVALVLAIGIPLSYWLLKDDLQRDVAAPYAGFYRWVQANTAPDTVFLPPFNHPLHQQLPCLGRRAVLASQAFPFSEGAFEEQIERTRLAYGTPDEIAHTPGRNL
ncbi:MAG: hypothetical protein K8T25_04310, partial [Planctomycetia bacterium]|nr:hypothetical protein [Planctomycetia bacterium]